MSQRNTTTSAPGAAKRLTIYCPSLDITYRNFILTPSADYNQFLVELRSAVGGIAAAWPWTTGGKRILTLDDIVDGQRVLVVTDYFEVVEMEEGEGKKKNE